MKTHKLVNKMSLQVFKKFPLSPISTELQQKLKFSAITLKIFRAKREDAFEYLTHISLVFWVVSKFPTIRAQVISLACQKIEQLKFASFFAIWAENQKSAPRNSGNMNFLKKNEI